jgi:hypothetical protein
MTWFAELLKIVPESETLTTLWPLLQAMLPYVSSTGTQHRVWTSFEEFLSTRIDSDPVKSIELYTMMHERSPRPIWAYPDEPMIHIIEQAVITLSSRRQALALIDMLGRRGEVRFRDLYEQYASL